MGLFTSLYTGVGGMMAQSNATATISNNIANSTTVGYKKSDTAFHDLVISNTKPANFANGGVFTHQVQRIDRQGELQQTVSRTEMGISGAGFFAVKKTDDPNTEFFYTRNGTFAPDQNGVLRNAAGFILYGWPIEPDGTVAGGNTLDSLQVVDIDELNEVHQQTSLAEFAANLDASEPLKNPDLYAPQQTLPLNNIVEADFSRTFNVVDGDGVTRDLVFEFRHITGPMATAASGTVGLDYTTPLANYLGINAGDTFTIDVDGTTQEYIIGAPAGAGQIRIDTAGELSNEINTNFGGGTVLDMSLDNDGRITFQATDPTATLTFTENVGTPLTGNNTFELVTQLGNAPLIYTPQTDIIGGAYPDQGNFPTIANQTNPSTKGWWEVSIMIADPADPANPNLPPVTLSTGLMSFNSDGSLNAVANTNGNIELTLANINFDNTSTTDTTSVTFDISRFTQFAGGYNVITQNHNGAEAGTLIGVDITRDGRVVASFTNSEEFEIFQVPLAKFINPNGLQAITGTVFAATEEAGEVEILAADNGGAGIIRASTVETSNVDIADEFANLIVTQRAFSANSRVVNTVDEMTQQLRTLKQ